MYKVDFHTHSEASPDGSLKIRDYQKMLIQGRLSYIAITDHNVIDFALDAHAQLGEHIIIGEEVLTSQGEIIGLFLKKRVPAGLSPLLTIKDIQDQGGLVYIPHPFETIRNGLSAEILNKIIDKIDIMEIFNGRAVFQNKSSTAKSWATRHGTATAASSDAHGLRGWGRTYTLLSEPPTRQNLCKLLNNAEVSSRSVGARGMLYPKLNRLRKKQKHVE